jgi:hypothetical protein
VLFHSSNGAAALPLARLQSRGMRPDRCLLPALPPPQRFTKSHVAMKCYGLGLGLDTFRMVGSLPSEPARQPAFNLRNVLLQQGRAAAALQRFACRG